MIALFCSRFFEKRLQTRIIAACRLTLIERLSADLADMIDAHERAGLSALGLAQRDWRAIADLSQGTRSAPSR